MRAICIRCWNPESVVKMHLDGSGDFECSECQETFGPDEVEAAFSSAKAAWSRILEWARAYPTEQA